MKTDTETFFRELKRDISAYVESKAELLKLNAYERIGKVISVLSYSLVLLILTFFLTLFLFIALAFFLSDLLHSMGAGFVIVAVLYLLIICALVLYRERFQAFVLNTVIAALTANENNKNEDEATDEHNSAGEVAGT